MCSGSIFKKMLMFALPLMCSSILQLLFNAADIVVVGRFAGDNALAAVGSNTALINLLTNLFVGLSIGSNVLTARYYGACLLYTSRGVLVQYLQLALTRAGYPVMPYRYLFQRYHPAPPDNLPLSMPAADTAQALLCHQDKYSAYIALLK